MKRIAALASGIVLALATALVVPWGQPPAVEDVAAFVEAPATRQAAGAGGLAGTQSSQSPANPGPGSPGEGAPGQRSVGESGLEPGERPEVPPPPFTDGIYPCTACHAGLPVNRTRRELADMHGDIVLRHDEQHRWCLDCHDAANRDVLHLASGEPVPFEESYRLCGQCHGEKLRDWRAGVHGRRTGEWNGRKQYLLCAHCHNPHQPRFAKLEPKPAPVRPTRSRQ